MDFSDKWLICTECGRQFLWDVGEQQWYYSKRFVHAPRRCKSCRHRKRDEQQAKICPSAAPKTLAFNE